MKTWAAFSPFFLTATQFTKMENQVNKFLFGLFLAAFSFLCHAVNIQNNSIESFNTTNIGEVTVITFNGISFSVVNVPTIASQFENSDSTATHTKLKANPCLTCRREVKTITVLLATGQSKVEDCSVTDDPSAANEQTA